MERNDIVKFINPNSEAGTFCKDRGLTGKVVDIVAKMVVVDAGLGYDIYAHAEELEVAARADEFPLESD